MSNKRGFTLIELLVVLVILGILALIGFAAFGTAQARSRDAKRKSDLKQIANALELYYNDHGAYPAFSATGEILGCPTPNTPCEWGGFSIQFTDGSTIYLKEIPKDPSNRSYYYRSVTVDGKPNQGYQLYALLETKTDSGACLGGDCVNPPALPGGVDCGATDSCNFAVTSSNVTATTDATELPSPTTSPTSSPTSSPTASPTLAPSGTASPTPTKSPTQPPITIPPFEVPTTPPAAVQ